MNRKRLAIVLIAMTLLTFLTLGLRAPRPANLGVRNGHLAPCPNSPNCVSSQSDEPQHRIEPLRYTGTQAGARAHLKKVLGELPRAKVITETDTYLHAEFTSAIFRFVDDAEFYFDTTNQVIHVRSASRVGHSDMGVNRKRIETIRQKWNSSPP
jgi:uncharacterized protein (DUF1499 family)